MPIFKLLLGLPRTAFFSWTGAFLGGIFFFFAKRQEVVEKACEGERTAAARAKGKGEEKER